MAKLNSTGIKAEKIDRIIDKAILGVGLGLETYSCCALSDVRGCVLGWKVREAYTHAFGPATIYPDNYGYAFATEVHKVTNDETKANFRILMLSLFKAAWRDLV